MLVPILAIHLLTFDNNVLWAPPLRSASWFSGFRYCIHSQMLVCPRHMIPPSTHFHDRAGISVLLVWAITLSKLLKANQCIWVLPPRELVIGCNSSISNLALYMNASILILSLIYSTFFLPFIQHSLHPVPHSPCSCPYMLTRSCSHFCILFHFLP